MMIANDVLSGLVMRLLRIQICEGFKVENLAIINWQASGLPPKKYWLETLVVCKFVV